MSDPYLEATKEIVISLIQNESIMLKPSHAVTSEERNSFALVELDKAISSIFKSLTNTYK